MTLPDFVRIYEVGPRDGLQNEKKIVPVATKSELVERLAKAGVTHIEAGAFVSPKWVPQMADSDKVLARIQRKEGVAYPVLVPNEKGLDAALACGVTEIAVFAAASESFSQKNINCSIEESLERFRSVIKRALDEGIKVRGYVSCVVGCPYEGEIAPAAVAKVADALNNMGCYEISLGDTIGVGTPSKIEAMLDAVIAQVSVDKLALHCHDTYGQALVNIYTGLQKGVRVIDTSVAGLGGCPYAPGASGNAATEDVVYMLHGMGIKTGINLDAIVDTAWWISGKLERPPSSRVALACRKTPPPGGFPPPSCK